ncbi:Dps family protein [Alienimonas californiensis]|uniref:Fine tangled pili major subunit n=1 Tax=Alienimonas californiensis TaxID=2527989 RepID=A0A517P8K9_9PLAN|nr:DNA starvation/stationary phase protection protein [Alienimonas californiensis]QDT15706.1 Fine tangled pili major subunit [Alienimonas californiensis]
MTFWKRNILPEEDAKVVCSALQDVLVALIDLGLQGKQAHWNLYGPDFQSLHEKLDAIVETARMSSDEVAERMNQLGIAPDGRRNAVAESSPLENYPAGFQPVPEALNLVGDRLHTAVETVRTARKTVADPDPMTEDLLIAISQQLEEHLWMIQAQEHNVAGGKPSKLP